MVFVAVVPWRFCFALLTCFVVVSWGLSYPKALVELCVAPAPEFPERWTFCCGAVRVLSLEKFGDQFVSLYCFMFRDTHTKNISDIKACPASCQQTRDDSRVFGRTHWHPGTGSLLSTVVGLPTSTVTADVILEVQERPKWPKQNGACNLGWSRWCFQIFFIFIPIWGRFPFWRIFFRWVGSTTNQMIHEKLIGSRSYQWTGHDWSENGSSGPGSLRDLRRWGGILQRNPRIPCLKLNVVEEALIFLSFWLRGILRFFFCME